MKSFNIHTMGCKANQFESSIIRENLLNNGFIESNKIEEADYYILNSCSVTHKSDNEALYLLRAAKNKNSKIINIVTGCFAQIEKENLLKFEYIDFVFGNNEKLNLYDCLKTGNKTMVSDVLTQDKFNDVKLYDITKTRASLKIQDGCNNRCTYCIIWKARGKSRSAKIDFIIEQINVLSQNGFKEVVLTGIHIGQWGTEWGLKLIHLLKEIENKTTIDRYRLGSLNPLEIDSDLINFLKMSQKFCPHFHMSLQSANDKILKSMNRLYKTEDYLKQLELINSSFELPFIGSDIIVGFAGESEEDFNITRVNLSKSCLTQIHTFPYSIRKGTVGAALPNQVNNSIKVERANIIKQISKDKYNTFVKKNIGTVKDIIIEKHRDKHTGNLKGMTRNYLTVQIVSDREDLYNTIQMVRILKIEDNIIFAEFI